MTSAIGREQIPVGERRVTTALSRRVPAGLLDSALSSLATFVTGFIAVHYLTAALLGAYALALTAFLLAGALTAVLSGTCVETDVVRELRPGDRAVVLRRSLPQAIWVAVFFAVLAGAATLVVPSGATSSERWGLAASCLLVSTISPLQDHARRMLHAALDSWGAALVSIAQLVTAAIAGTLAVFGGLGTRSWAPFLVLALANAVSLSIAILRVRGPLPEAAELLEMSLGRSVRFGRDLAFAAGFGFGSTFIATAIVIGRAGPASAGTAEAARVLAQPLTLVSVGLLTVLVPDLMSASAKSDVRRLRRLVPSFVGAMTVVTVIWALIAWRPWSWSPLPDLSPNAYSIPGLVLLTVPAQMLAYVAAFGTVVSQAVGRLRKLAITQVVTSLIGLGVAAVLARHGAWALVISALVNGGLLLGSCLILVLGPERWSMVPRRIQERDAANL